ncbi:MAG: helix-turn-helix transcriptional regulator [Pseudomonadota bacterium]
MVDATDIAKIAALLGDPARANMVCALLDGRAHTASELAAVAGIGAPTASVHLARLVEGGLLAVEKQGRHRYYRLSGQETARAIESLSALAPAQRPSKPQRTGPREARLRHCRTCYDHLAGEVAVALAEACCARGWLIEEAEAFALTEAGVAGFTALGADPTTLGPGRRRLASRCLDWSERRAHLGGALGAALLGALIERGWVAREAGTRRAWVTEAGIAGLDRVLGFSVPPQPPEAAPRAPRKASIRT